MKKLKTSESRGTCSGRVITLYHERDKTNQKSHTNKTGAIPRRERLRFYERIVK